MFYDKIINFLNELGVSNVNFNYIILILLVFLFSGFIIFILISYILIKILKLNIDNNNVLFYQYNKKSKELLDKYGHYKLTKMYLIRQPLHQFITFFLNIFTLYNYEKMIRESHDNFPYHTLLVCEITLDTGMKKMLMIEKNNSINITDNFLITNKHEIKELNIKKNTYSLIDILNKTQERVGNEKFFNWHLYTNNCQEFTKEMLKSIGKYTKKNREFIFRDKLLKIIIPSEFTLHVCNCICCIYNIIGKYILG